MGIPGTCPTSVAVSSPLTKQDQGEAEAHHSERGLCVWVMEALPVVEVVDLLHVPKQHALLAVQTGRDKVGHQGVVHLSGIALQDGGGQLGAPAHQWGMRTRQGEATRSCHSVSCLFTQD